MFARVLDGLTKTIQAGLVSFMVTMRKVETSNAKSSIDELLQLSDFPTGGAEGTHNLGLTLGRVGLAQNRVQGNVGSTKFGSRRSNVGLAKRHG